MAETTKITALDNGPFLVNGSVELTDAEGKAYSTEKETIALCRCAASTNQPFCDGTHSRIGFEAAERAVPQAG